MAQLDYELSGDILDRVAKAGKTVRPEFGIGDAIGEVGDSITEKVEEVKGQREGDTAAWDEGFAKMGDRGSWASGELFDEFQTMEAGYKDKYLEAVRSNNKPEMQRLLQDQGNRSSALQGWKDTMETAKQINDGVGWGNIMSKNPENQKILEALASNDGRAKMRMGEDNEMVFDIVIGDKTRTVTRREVDDMVAKGVKPVERQLMFMQDLESWDEKGRKGTRFSLDNQIKRNLTSIKDDEIESLMYEDLTGSGTFVDHMQSHPEFKAAYADGGFMSSIDKNKDGELTSAEMEGFSTADMELIIDEMQKDPKASKAYLAEWMALQQQAAYKGGQQTSEEDASAARFNSMGKDAQAVELQAKADKDMVESLGGDATLIQAYFSQSNN